MKTIRSGIILTVLAFFLLPTDVFGATLYVKTTGNDANPGTSWAAAKKTVQAAVNAANALDDIWVAAGTYNEHIANKAVGDAAVDVALYGGFAGNEILRSERDIAANLTVLHGTNNGIVVTIKYAAGRATRIDGFYITGGNKSSAPGDPGGGIHITASAPTIANNIIKGNLSYGIGAGISIWGYRPLPGDGAEYPLIVNNTIVDNFIYEFAGDGGEPNGDGSSAPDSYCCQGHRDRQRDRRARHDESRHALAPSAQGTHGLDVRRGPGEAPGGDIPRRPGEVPAGHARRGQLLECLQAIQRLDEPSGVQPTVATPGGSTAESG